MIEEFDIERIIQDEDLEDGKEEFDSVAECISILNDYGVNEQVVRARYCETDIFYDPLRAVEDSEKYIGEQVIAHGNCCKTSEEMILAASNSLQRRINIERDIEDVLRPLPENWARIALKISTAALNPFCLILSRKSFRQFFTEGIKESEDWASDNKIILPVFEYGKRFMQFYAEDGRIPMELKPKFRQCHEFANQLLTNHQRLFFTYRNIAEAERRLEGIIFPK